jgi:hypothetical protein
MTGACLGRPGAQRCLFLFGTLLSKKLEQLGQNKSPRVRSEEHAYKKVGQLARHAEIYAFGFQGPQVCPGLEFEPHRNP